MHCFEVVELQKLAEVEKITQKTTPKSKKSEKWLKKSKESCNNLTGLLTKHFHHRAEPCKSDKNDRYKVERDKWGVNKETIKIKLLLDDENEFKKKENEWER